MFFPSLPSSITAYSFVGWDHRTDRPCRHLFCPESLLLLFLPACLGREQEQMDWMPGICFCFFRTANTLGAEIRRPTTGSLSGCWKGALLFCFGILLGRCSPPNTHLDPLFPAFLFFAFLFSCDFIHSNLDESPVDVGPVSRLLEEVGRRWPLILDTDGRCTV